MNNSRQNVQATLVPSEIVMNENYTCNFPLDYGRGIMQSNSLVFKETIEESLGHNENKQIQLNNLDAFILSIVLDYLNKNNSEGSKEELYITIPQFSNSLPILLTYHLVFNHLAFRLKSNENSFSLFQQDEGILLVSHNIDLFQHVWNSSLNNVYLRDFFPTYLIKGEKFKVFNFNHDTKSSHKKDDGTLPWIGFYRAHRKKMVKKLDKQVKVIILDLMPIYHRKRANELIKWAKEHAENVIIIMPSNDNNLSYAVRNQQRNYVISQSTACIFEILMPFTINNLWYPTWGTAHSLKYIEMQKRNFEIHEYSKVDKNTVDLLKDFERAIQDCKKRNGLLPEKYRKIESLKIHMCNIITPLKDFEISKQKDRILGIFDQYQIYKSIPPQDFEEESLEKNLAHHLYKAFEELYKVFYGAEYSMRGKLLLHALMEVKASFKVVILVIDEYEISLLQEYLLRHTDITLELFTYKEFNSMQLKNDYPAYDILVLTTPFPNKYISGFNVMDLKVKLISLFSDTIKYFKQIELVYDNKRDINNMLRILSLNHGLNVSEIRLNRTAPNVNYIKSGEYIINDSITKDIDNVVSINIFDDIKLLELLKSNKEYNLKIIDLKVLKYTQKRSLSTVSQLIEFEDLEGNKERMFIPIEDHLKIQRANKNTVETIGLNKVKIDDLWVKINYDQKKDLFQEILKMASSTLIMKWISEGLNIWIDLLKTVWNRYYRGQRFKKEVYEVIRREINLNGGNVSSYLTVSNWFNNINLVRDEENLKALIIISGKPKLLDSKRIVLSSISELRSIHIQLGRAISKIINIQSQKLIDYESIEEWINIGKDIVIATEDITSLIDIVRIVDFPLGAKVFIPNELVYQKISIEMANEIIEAFIYEEETP